MPEGSEFHTEGGSDAETAGGKGARPGEPTTYWCWRSVENLQECGNSEHSTCKQANKKACNLGFVLENYSRHCSTCLRIVGNEAE